MSTVEQLICANLRGENPVWLEQHDEEFIARFLTLSAYHGVRPLLYRSLQSAQGRALNWPKIVLDECRNTAIIEAIGEMRHQIILKKVLTRLLEIGVSPILFKGTALAYDIYPSPFLRTRGDTDLLVPFDARDMVCTTLEAMKFKCVSGVRGDLISNTAVYSPSDPAFGQYQLDIHWRINNAATLSRLFSYDELLLEARRLPTLSADAIAAGSVHALLIACMHRAAHKEAPYFVNGIEYYGGDRLIWLYDVHLLLGKLTPSQCERFVEIAIQKGLVETCLEAVAQSCDYFNTTVPQALRQAVIRPLAAGTASRYLSGSAVYRYYANFIAIEGASNKIRYLFQLLFPPEEYMRRAYSKVKPNWLPWLYFRRAVIEIFKRIRRTCNTSRA